LALAISLRQSQLSKVRRDTSCLILLESKLARRALAGLFLEIDIGELLPGAVDHDKARF